jgi:hypothetical protein
VHIGRINRSGVVVALSATLVFAVAAAPALATVSLTISDNDATPASAVVGPGQTFKFTVNLVSTAEQTAGLDYYLTTPNGSGLISIVDRNTTGSTYVDPLFADDATVESPPSNILDPRNDHDLGALATGTNGAGTFLVAEFTMMVSASAPNGLYTIQTTTAQPSEGWIDPDSGEHPFTSHGLFTISVPEPASAAVAGILAAGAVIRRRRSASVA